MAAYYNEHDAFAAAWLRELIREGLIADGEVDERDIRTVEPSDLRGFTQCHFFAGIGGWSLALRLAGWPDDRPVWTGSCPCQPFSSAGQQKGGADDRHLWPYWARLIRECRPATVLGEQVESAIAHGWLDAVFDDLEREDYAYGAASLPAASVGAPHLRQRVWFVADAEHAERWSLSVNRQDERDGQNSGRPEAHRQPGARGEVRDMAEPGGERCDGERLRLQPGESRQAGVEVGRGGETGAVGDSSREGLPERVSLGGVQPGPLGAHAGQAIECGSNTGFWSACDWLPCRDGKYRPAQRGIQPLVTRLPGNVVPSGDPGASYANATAEARIGRLRGYGNSIVPQVAAAFIEAYVSAQKSDGTGA